MSLKTLSIYLNIAFLALFAVWFFLPKGSPRKEIKQDRREINRLEAQIKDLQREVQTAQKAKEIALTRADSIAQARTPIQYIIKKQNEKIDSIKNLPAVLPDTALVRILSGFKTAPEK
jgi:septal ring factor EnvC (AmiA/AmiB activator)